MEIRRNTPATGYWYDFSLKDDPHIISWIWDRINESDTDVRHGLAGNITRSNRLVDKDDYFVKNVISKIFTRESGGKNILSLKMTSFWVNWQYKHEFNPLHTHQGCDYSFVIWMKIPTNWNDQLDLPHLHGMKENQKRASAFEFQYLDMLGHIIASPYRMDPILENTGVFFPSELNHQVFPFYGTDDPRISISGNIRILNDENMVEIG